MKFVKLILLFSITLSLFSCQQEKDFYYYFDGYNNMEAFAKDLAKLNGNSFLYNGLGYYPSSRKWHFHYCIWSYRTIGDNTYLIVYKFNKHDKKFYRVYNYSESIKWLDEFNETDVRKYIFWHLGVLDGAPIVFNQKVNGACQSYDFDVSHYDYLKNDTISNGFLRTLRRDIIKYGLFKE